MVPTITSVLFLGALASAPALGAQGQTTTDKRPTEATHSAAGIEFTLPVTGLTQDNIGSIQSALGRISVDVYECVECGDVRPAAGMCTDCGTRLMKTSEPVFDRLAPTADKGTIVFGLSPSVAVRLSQIESALGAVSVRVQREKIDLGSRTTLIYTGAEAAGDASALQEALRAAKATDAAAVLDPATMEVRVRLAKGGMRWSTLEELGEELDQPLRLTDVAWGTLAAPTRS